MTESTVQDVMPPDVQTNDTAPTQAFSFGDPIPVLERRKLLDYVAYVQMDKWYEPPMSFDGLARTVPLCITAHRLPLSVTFSAVHISRTACLVSRLLPVLFSMTWYLATPTWKSVLTGSVECCHWSRPWRNTRGAELSSTPIGSCNTV